MKGSLNAIKPQQIPDNVFKLIGEDWMLITAGTPERFNTMTASWGGMGILWGKEVCWCVIRPHRYTYQFMEAAERFTLSFFEERYREALNICGTKSGRDTDKVAASGLTPAQTESGAIYFAEARLVIECKKIYSHDIDPRHFLDPDIASNYPKKDYHRMYLGEIVRCLSK